MDLDKMRERLRNEESLRDRVARRAFEIYAHRGYHGGREAEDWFQAEHEILHQLLDEDQNRDGMAQAALEPEVPAVIGISGEASAPAPEAQDKTPVGDSSVASVPANKAAAKQPSTAADKEAKKKVTTPKKAAEPAKSSSKKSAKSTKPTA